MCDWFLVVCYSIKYFVFCYANIVFVVSGKVNHCWLSADWRCVGWSQMSTVKIINISPNNRISLVVAWPLLMASRYAFTFATAQSYSTPIRRNVPEVANCKHISCTEVLRDWGNDSIQWCFPCVCNYKFWVFSEASLRKWIPSFF